jgi:tetratricopeptide (TPR) repeat protein
MGVHRILLNCIVAALLPIVIGIGPVLAQTEKLDGLFAELPTAAPDAVKRIEREIWAEWSKSGSPSMDLLLERGRAAMQAGDLQAAIEHLTALTDHAPDFAEGWNARATAYFQAGEYGPSIEDIGRTLTLNPRHFGALSGLGMILEQLGDEERALEAYKAALAIHPQLEGIQDTVERLESEAAGQEL